MDRRLLLLTLYLAQSKNPKQIYVSMHHGFIRGTLPGNGETVQVDAYWDFGHMKYPEAFYGFGNTMQIPHTVIIDDTEYMYTDYPNKRRKARGIKVDGDQMIPVGYVRNLGSSSKGGDGKHGLELWSDTNNNRSTPTNFNKFIP